MIEAYNKRFDGLDFFKTIACFAVVHNHTTYSCDGLYRYLCALCNFAVPFFFMVSAFFYKIDRKKTIRKILHLLYYIFFAMVLEVLYSRFFGSTWNISKYNVSVLLSTNACYLFQKSQPLWFIFALIYCYFFLIIVGDKLEKLMSHLYFCLIFICFVLEIFLYLGVLQNNCFYRNFIFEGLPCIIMGYCIRKRIDYIVENKRKLLLLLPILFFLSYFVSFAFNIRFEIMPDNIILCLIFFIISICYFGNMNRLICLVCWFGKNCSFYVYVFHLYINSLLSRFFPAVNSCRFRAFVNIFFCFIFACMLYGIFRFLKNRFFENLINFFSGRKKCT